jgi:hypothetical protein
MRGIREVMGVIHDVNWFNRNPEDTWMATFSKSGLAVPQMLNHVQHMFSSQHLLNLGFCQDLQRLSTSFNSKLACTIPTTSYNLHKLAAVFEARSSNSYAPLPSFAMRSTWVLLQISQ